MPLIHLENCTNCMKCVNDCPSHAIDIQAGIISDTCIHCGHCVAICPEATIMPDVGDIQPLGDSEITADKYKVFTAGLRSIRNYSNKELSDATIDLLTDNMKNYASASNARLLKIKIVRSKDKIQLLNKLTLQSITRPLKLLSSPWLLPVVRILAPSLNVKRLKRYNDSFIEQQKTNSSIVCHHAPVIMLFHGPKPKFGFLEADANIWATHTTMYAKTLGLGSCFIGFIVRAMERNKTLRREMEIPENHRVYVALALGYPKITYRNETSRKSPTVSFV